MDVAPHRRGMDAAGFPSTLDDWYREQLAFLEAHTYFTPVAGALRNPGKRRNIERLRERLHA